MGIRFSETSSLTVRRSRPRQPNPCQICCKTCWSSFRSVSGLDWFQNLTLGVIVFNACWIGIDTQYNYENSGPQDLFKTVEHMFCVYFTTELMLRFIAFARCREMFRNAWFMFDGVLVFFMVLETWLLPLLLMMAASGGEAPLGNLSILRLLRLLRLTRIARLMRAVPELLTLVKSMVAATKAVSFILFFLLLVLYLGAIIFVSQLRDNEDEDVQMYFGSIGSAMLSLLCNCVLLDDLTAIIPVIRAQCGEILLWVYFFFMLIGSFTVLNMILGMLCEVVADCSRAEATRTNEEEVHRKLTEAYESMDESQDGLLSRSEFAQMRSMPQVRATMQVLNVDAAELEMHLDKLQGALFGDAKCDEDKMKFLEDWVVDGVQISECGLFAGEGFLPTDEDVVWAQHANVKSITFKVVQIDRPFRLELTKQAIGDDDDEGDAEDFSVDFLEGGYASACGDGGQGGDHDDFDFRYAVGDIYTIEIERSRLVLSLGVELLKTWECKSEGLYTKLSLLDQDASVQIMDLVEGHKERAINREEFVRNIIDLQPQSTASSLDVENIKYVLRREIFLVNSSLEKLQERMVAIDGAVGLSSIAAGQSPEASDGKGRGLLPQSKGVAELEMTAITPAAPAPPPPVAPYLAPLSASSYCGPPWPPPVSDLPILRPAGKSPRSPNRSSRTPGEELISGQKKTLFIASSSSEEAAPLCGDAAQEDDPLQGASRASASATGVDEAEAAQHRGSSSLGTLSDQALFFALTLQAAGNGGFPEHCASGHLTGRLLAPLQSPNSSSSTSEEVPVVPSAARSCQRSPRSPSSCKKSMRRRLSCTNKEDLEGDLDAALESQRTPASPQSSGLKARARRTRRISS